MLGKYKSLKKKLIFSILVRWVCLCFIKCPNRDSGLGIVILISTFTLILHNMLKIKLHLEFPCYLMINIVY